MSSTGWTQTLFKWSLGFLCALAAYVIIFFILHPLIGTSVGTFEVVPVIVVAWLYGTRIGILTALLVSFLDLFILFPIVGEKTSEVFLRGGWAGLFADLFLALVIGQLHDLNAKVKNELLERRRAEDEVRRARDELEMRVRERTADLQASERNYRLLLEQVSDGIFIATQIGDLLIVNRRACELSGYTEEELTRMDIADLFTAVSTSSAAETALGKLRADETVLKEMSLRCKNGMQLPVEVSTKMLSDGRFQAIFRDITERKQAEEALRQSERHVRNILNGLPELLWMTTPEGIILDVNTAALEAAGAKREEVQGKLLEEMSCWSFSEERILWLRETLARAAGGETSKHDIDARIADGRTVWWNFTVAPVSYAAGQVAYLILSAVDISRRKSAEAALRGAEEYFSSLIENAPDLISVISADGVVLYDSPSQERVLGYTPEERIGRTALDRIHVDDLDRVMQELKEVLERGRTIAPVEYRYRHKDGSWRVMEGVGHRFINAAGEPNVIINTRDVTERKRAEEELKKREEFYRALIENSTDNITVVNADGITIYDNPSAELLTGYKPEELIGKNPFERIHPDDKQFVVKIFEDAMQQDTAGAPVEYRLRHKNGSWRILESVGRRYVDESGQLIGIINTRDVTEQRLAKEALQKSEKRYRSLAVASSQVVWTADAEGNVTEVTQWRALTNLSVDEVKGQGWLAVIHPEDRERTTMLWKEAVRTKSLFSTDYRVRMLDGNYRLYSVRSVPVLDDAGNVQEWIGTCTDITERKQAEEILRQTEEQLRQAQKLEAVGLLAGGVAHDFNNMLTAITGYSELALRRLNLEDPLRRNFTEIRRAADRAASLTHQLLAFSRNQILQPKVINLNNVVENSSKMMRRLIGENIEVQTNLSPHLGAVLADPGQIEQVIMNLMLNARDAMPKGGRITIETANINLEDADASQHESVAPGHYVMLSVADTGFGMDEQTQARIFDPFFTTKEIGKGTGLGLAMVYGIVKQSEGNIRVRSEVSKGTTFEIYLPQAEGISEAEDESKRDEELAQATETVLLIEDDATLRRMSQEILESYGYKVLPAANGAEALEVAERYKNKIHIIVTDVMMPGLSGRDLEGELKKIRADIKVLYMSGYTDDAIVNHGVLQAGVEFLPKPFTVDALLHKVRETLAH